LVSKTGGKYMTELYKKYRPRKLEQVIGQESAVRSLIKLMAKGAKGDIPHALLLTGPSGVGKTTIARILKKVLECGNADFQEVNSSDDRGVESIRLIRRRMNLAPIEGACRIWVLDEAHKLTNDAQNAVLKMLEDTPGHVYFILLTTDSTKLIKAIHTRCTEVRLVSLSEKALTDLLLDVVAAEDLQVSNDVIQGIVECSEGSARKALVILGQIAGLEGDAEQMRGVQASSVNKSAAIDLARALINPKAQWAPVATILKDLKDEDPEGLRYLVLGYSRSVLLGGGPLATRAFMIIDYFSENFYDSKQAGLAAACWAVVHHR
jgi:DNA polymerase-3 subunit gamma/tau